MEHSVQEAVEALNSDDVRFTIHHKPRCIVEFAVEAFGKLVKTALDTAIKAIAKEVALPGFRKGKVPPALIEKNFHAEIDKQWQQEIATQSLQACQKLSKIRPLQADGKVTFAMKSHSKSGALLTLSFEVEPTIPSVDPKQFALKPVKRPEVNEEKVQETLRQIQLFFATWQSVEDRPVAMGDFVLLDVDVIEEDPPTSLFSDTRFEVAEKSMAKWMLELVFGKERGASFEGISIPDESASQEDKETLKPKKVRVTLKSIDIPTIPPLDDSLLKMLGVTSFEELNTKITDLLNNQADAHVKEAQRTQASDYLLTAYPFALPATLVFDETRFRFKQLSQDPDFQNYWNHLPQEDRNKTFHLINSQAEKAVRLFYLCQKIVKEAQISITANDIPPPSSTPLEILLNPQKTHHHARTPEIEHAEAYSRILLEKAEDYLITTALQNS
jgi:trigger factor